MVYLITGSGGREHALAWKLSQSTQVKKIYCMPGNAGTAHTPKCENIESMDIHELVRWSQEHQVKRLMVGSEVLLVDGIVDVFTQEGIEVIGPHQEAAQLEGSKSFAKKFMTEQGVRTAEYQVCYEIEEAQQCIEKSSYPLVIKADGLAAGKGVIICQNVDEAREALVLTMQERAFGSAGDKIVIEQYLTGFESSILALYDGSTIIPMVSAKDHKKIFDGELGKNTGGMGVLAPNPLFTRAHYDDFITNILEPTQRGLEKEGLNFKGIIFFGLMIQDDVCYLLEYNTRFGDPEIQTLLTLLTSDLHEHFNDMMRGTLSIDDMQWKDEKACCVVLASQGYPDAFEKEKEVTIPEGLDSFVFTAGVTLVAKESPQRETMLESAHTPSTVHSDYTWLTNGGRVLNVIGLGKDWKEAHEKVYGEIKTIYFHNMYYRKDIGYADT